MVDHKHIKTICRRITSVDVFDMEANMLLDAGWDFYALDRHGSTVKILESDGESYILAIMHETED